MNFADNYERFVQSGYRIPQLVQCSQIASPDKFNRIQTLVSRELR